MTLPEIWAKSIRSRVDQHVLHFEKPQKRDQMMSVMTNVQSSIEDELGFPSRASTKVGMRAIRRASTMIGTTTIQNQVEPVHAVWMSSSCPLIVDTGCLLVDFGSETLIYLCEMNLADLTGINEKMSNFTLQTPTVNIIIGPMKSAKTSEGIRIAQTYSRYVSVLFVSPKKDIRVSNGSTESRSGLKWACTSVAYLSELEIISEFQDAKLLILDESQFYPDLLEHVSKWSDEKSYWVIGLDGDSDQKRFGQILDLIPLADDVQKLKALCEVCKDGTPAPFTKSLVPKTGQVRVEPKGGNSYIAVCRKHRK